jgi:surfeit locus 1 family protein
MRHQTDWQFKPPLWAWPLTLLTVIAFSSLSLWQLDRAEEKQALLDRFAQDEEPVAAARQVQLEDLPPYAPLRLEGEFLRERQFLLENMRRESRPGFHVWSPLRLSGDGAVIMVDRGWIAESDAPPALPPAGDVHVYGRLDALPRPGFRLSAPEPEGDWPRRIYFPEVDDLRAQLNENVFDGRLLMSADHDTDVPGFRRDWQPINMPPERHLGYAFQWAALAIAVFVVFLVVNIKRVKKHEQD